MQLRQHWYESTRAHFMATTSPSAPMVIELCLYLCIQKQISVGNHSSGSSKEDSEPRSASAIQCTCFRAVVPQGPSYSYVHGDDVYGLISLHIPH